MKEIGIGLLGFGTVGAGVVDGLHRNGALLARRAGVRPVLKRIADVDLDRDRGVKVDRSLLTTDAASVVDDPSVQVVVELIGGTRFAHEMVMRAVSLGKPVVTANKALLAERGREIFDAAVRKGTGIHFEASVCGVPIIKALREGLVANRIRSMCGILNGTCNYILTRMTDEGIPFDVVLAEAQRNGYAEADPGLDIDGHDTAHKAAILASLAYGFHVPMGAVGVEGIRGMAEADIRYARDLGYRIKLLAVIREDGGRVEVGVRPTLVPEGHMLASVSGVFNAVMVDGDLTGPTLYYGRGAGRYPTASAVLSDIADASMILAAGGPPRGSPFNAVEDASLCAKEEVTTCHYLRLSLRDRPGALAKITAALGSREVSIASALQKEARSGEFVPVVIMTHRARESDVASALAEIDAMADVGAPTVRLRVEREQ